MYVKIISVFSCCFEKLRKGKHYIDSNKQKRTFFFKKISFYNRQQMNTMKI